MALYLIFATPQAILAILSAKVTALFGNWTNTAHH
jgi:hypothetical protein